MVMLPRPMRSRLRRDLPSLARANRVPTTNWLYAVAGKIGGDAAQAGSRVDRVGPRIRQHHDHVARVAVTSISPVKSLTQT